MDLMEDENDEDLTYLTFVSHKNGDGVHILCRSYSRKEQLWLSPLFCCLQGTKTLNNLKKHIYKLLFLNKSSYIVDCFVYLCVQIKDICK
jgi:hypothetical protein